MPARLKWSESLTFGQIAQLVERRTENPCVPGSIPGLATISYGFPRGRPFFFAPGRGQSARLSETAQKAPHRISTRRLCSRLFPSRAARRFMRPPVVPRAEWGVSFADDFADGFQFFRLRIPLCRDEVSSLAELVPCVYQGNALLEGFFGIFVHPLYRFRQQLAESFRSVSGIIAAHGRVAEPFWPLALPRPHVMVGMKGCSGLPFHVDFVALAMSE